MRKIQAILEEIDSFSPEGAGWAKLDNLINELWETGHPEDGMKIMLKVLERFPDEDGDGVLWSIVHSLENLDNYERELLNSVYRQPSHLGITMIHRIENVNQHELCGRNIKEIYQELLIHPKLTDITREDVIRLLS